MQLKQETIFLILQLVLPIHAVTEKCKVVEIVQVFVITKTHSSMLHLLVNCSSKFSQDSFFQILLCQLYDQDKSKSSYLKVVFLVRIQSCQAM